MSVRSKLFYGNPYGDETRFIVGGQPNWIKDTPKMTTAMTAPTIDASVVERVLLHGDLKQLTPAQKISYYQKVCESVGLNAITQPFAYLVLNGKEQLYAKRECTEQLRFIHSVSIDPKHFTREVIEGIYVVTAPASLPSGRTDVSTGAVSIEGLKGEARANAMMKAETKAKRRVTLSICGLGMLDETEVDSIPGATTHEPVVQQNPDGGYPPIPKPLPPPPKFSIAADGRAADTTTGEVYPPGFFPIEDVKEDGQFLQVFWGRDAQGGWRKYTTKVPHLRNAAQAAYDDGVPVRLEIKDGKYINKVERWLES